MDASLAAVVSGVSVASVTGLAAWVNSRRTTSGKIHTSEAATLWAAAEKLRAETVAERDKALEQRDRLLDSQTTMVLPTLSSINDSLRQITESLARMEGRNGDTG